MKILNKIFKYCMFKMLCAIDKIICIYANKQYFPKLIFIYDYIIYGLFLDFVRSYKPLFHSIFMFAITYKCNCSCGKCGVKSYERQDTRELNRDDIVALIRDCYKQGLRCIYFFGGEPFVSPYIVEYVSYASRLGMYTQVDTNGYFLNEEKIKELKKAKIDFVRFSLDSMDREKHDSLRGINGIGQNVFTSVVLCKKYKIKCGLSVSVTKENLRDGELKKLVEYAKRIKIPIRLLSSIRCGNWLTRDDVTLSDDDIALLRTYLEKPLVYWEVPNVSRPNSRFFCCATNRKIIYLSPYGDVQPCCYVPISFGNIHKESLESIIPRIWKSDLMLTRGTKEKEKYFYKDCIANSPWFRKHYARYIPDDGPYPYDYNVIVSLREQSEKNRKNVGEE